MKQCTFLFGILVGCLGLTVASVTRAEVIYHTVDYSPGVIAGWSRIDFDGDGTNELSFDLYALGHEYAAVFFFTAHPSVCTELLLDTSSVLPLDWGDPISDAPDLGHWSGARYGATVWTYSIRSLPPLQPTNVPVPIIGVPLPPDLFPIQITNTPAPIVQPVLAMVATPQPPPGRGVAMPGYGSFFGVRFQSGGNWLYGWVRLRNLDSPWSIWPSVLDYAYETDPEIGIFAGAGIDSDTDGVWDLFDQCLDTPTGDVVDAEGCSISQLVPCEGPWKNHGEYVSHVVRTAAQFEQEGLISHAEAQWVVRQAAQSDCGKPEARRSQHRRPE